MGVAQCRMLFVSCLNIQYLHKKGKAKFKGKVWKRKSKSPGLTLHTWGTHWRPCALLPLAGHLRRKESKDWLYPNRGGKKTPASIRLLDATQTTPSALSGGMAGGCKCSRCSAPGAHFTSIGVKCAWLLFEDRSLQLQREMLRSCLIDWLWWIRWHVCRVSVAG